MDVRPSADAIRLSLYLSYIRSFAIVGQALASAFPTEADWNKVRSSPEFIGDLNYLAGVLTTIKLNADNLTDDELEQFITTNYDLAAEAMMDFSQKYAVPVEDLLYVLIHG